MIQVTKMVDGKPFLLRGEHVVRFEGGHVYWEERGDIKSTWVTETCDQIQRRILIDKYPQLAPGMAADYYERLHTDA